MYEQSAICCTLNNVPISAKTLQKSRLPFAVHLFPFAYDDQLPRSKDGMMVRCTVCRAYINPYVRIPDRTTWQCNLCFRHNELPPQFLYDYENKQYYEMDKKLELNSESIEYIAGVEYMVRPPQPATYIFLFDCSKAAQEIGYIPVMASAIIDCLDDLPGDARTSVGFIAFDSNIHYFSFIGTKVIHHVCPDLTTTISPCSTDGLLANLVSKREMIIDFLNDTISRFASGQNFSLSSSIKDQKSALGPAIKAAASILRPIGGRISIMLAQIPNHGNGEDGCLAPRRDNQARNKPPPNDKNGEYLRSLLEPSVEFYRDIALDCCEHQISIDLFNVATGYVDLAGLSPLCKISAGTLFHYSNTIPENQTTLARYGEDLRTNLSRPVGLEAVLRLRITRGLKIHSFHGNCFVRSQNLLVLANANPDASFAFQISMEDDLKIEDRFVFFQASLLYTTPNGERRIRVHTARYPTVTTLPEVIYGANQSAIVAILAKMAVDKSVRVSVGEAKEALIGSGVDLLETYMIADENRARSYAMGLPENLRSVPLYILAILKHIALKLTPNIGLDDRFAAMERFKTLPVDDLITYIYPDLIPIHMIPGNNSSHDWKCPIQLTAAHIERNGAYLLDAYDVMIIYICEYIDPSWCHYVLGVNDYSQITEVHDFAIPNTYDQQLRPRVPSQFNDTSPVQSQSHALDQSPSKINRLAPLPELENQISIKLRNYIINLIESRPQTPKFYILKDRSKSRFLFTQYLIDDRSESYHSYPEFWKFLQDQACK